MPNSEDRRLYGDEATHILAAISVWEDSDFVYDLGDLSRFRENMPAVNGPRGAFLKVGRDNTLYYAKPILYSIYSSPFVGAVGITGFLVANFLCLSLIAALSIKILSGISGRLNAIIMTCCFLIFSPFLAWTPVAHPDLFIATLLFLGGFLVLEHPGKARALLLNKYIGAVILGLVVYEKPTFVIIVALIILARPSHKTLVTVPMLATCVILGWLIPTSIHLLQDGNLSAYSGLRFYVRQINGNFPLESGWSGLPRQAITEKVFEINSLILLIRDNIAIFPEKILDSLIGRHTGILVYFPGFIFIAYLLLVRLSWRSALVASGFLIYLAINWLVFPTNGYGGAGTYGPRYTMQALPVLILALTLSNPKNIPFLFNEKGNTQRYMIFLCLVFSFILQGHVLFSVGNLVGSPHQFTLSKLAMRFPLEKSILIVSKFMMPARLSESDKQGNFLFRVGEDLEHCYDTPVKDSIQKDSLILYQIGKLKPTPNLWLTSSQDTFVQFYLKNTLLTETLLEAGKPERISIGDVFSREFHDRLTGEIRWANVTVTTKALNTFEENRHALLNIKLKEPEEINTTYSLGNVLAPSDFRQEGILPVFCWQSDAYNFWSSGKLAGLNIRLSEKAPGALILRMRVKPFIQEDGVPVNVNILVGDELIKSVSLSEKFQSYNLVVNLPEGQLKNRDEFTVLFDIQNPAQPSRLDYRYLGFSIMNLAIEDGSAKKDEFETPSEFYFHSKGNGMFLLAEGWHSAENWGVWGDGANSLLILPYKLEYDIGLRLEFDVQAYLPPQIPAQIFTVYVNGKSIEKWIFKRSDEKKRVMTVPSSLLYPGKPVEIRFQADYVKSPKQLGRGTDARSLGIGLKGVRILDLVEPSHSY